MLTNAAGPEARLQYLSGSYRRLTAGDHVRCAVTGAPIPLAELRYWSAELQEAYASVEVAAARFQQALDEGLIQR